MDNFEESLRRALRHRDAPEGFADRAMRRVAREPVQMRRPAQPLGRHWMAGALAASLLAGLAGGLMEREHRQRQREAAERQFALAMQVTSRALAQTRLQLGRSDNRLVRSLSE